MARKKRFISRRLYVNIPEEIYKEIDKIAQKRHETITSVVKQALIERIAWEKQYE